jgi:hypothetical protein
MMQVCNTKPTILSAYTKNTAHIAGSMVCRCLGGLWPRFSLRGHKYWWQVLMPSQSSTQTHKDLQSPITQTCEYYTHEFLCKFTCEYLHGTRTCSSALIVGCLFPDSSLFLFNLAMDVVKILQKVVKALVESGGKQWTN